MSETCEFSLNRSFLRMRKQERQSERKRESPIDISISRVHVSRLSRECKHRPRAPDDDDARDRAVHRRCCASSPRFGGEHEVRARNYLFTLTARSPDAYVGGGQRDCRRMRRQAFDRTSRIPSGRPSVRGSIAATDNVDLDVVIVVIMIIIIMITVLERIVSESITDRYPITVDHPHVCTRSGVCGGPRHARCSRGEIDDRSCAPAAPAARFSFFSDE